MNNAEPLDGRPGKPASRPQRLLTVGLLVVTACTGIVGTMATPEGERDAQPASAADPGTTPAAPAGTERTDEQRKAEDDFVERFRFAQRLMGRKEDERAEKLMRELIAEQPEQAALHHALAVLLQFRKRPDEATASFLRACELDPNEPVIRRDTGLHL